MNFRQRKQQAMIYLMCNLCLALLITRKIQIKTITGYHFHCQANSPKSSKPSQEMLKCSLCSINCYIYSREQIGRVYQLSRYIYIYIYSSFQKFLFKAYDFANTCVQEEYKEINFIVLLFITKLWKDLFFNRRISKWSYVHIVANYARNQDK